MATIPTPVQMRGTPSLSAALSNPDNWYAYIDGVTQTPTEVSIYGVCSGAVILRFTVSGATRGGHYVALKNGVEGGISADL